MTIRQVLAVRDTDAAEPDPEAAMARVASARVASARPAMDAAQARPDGAVSGPELPVRVPASGVPTAKPMAPRRRWWHRSTVIGAAVAVMVLGSTPSSSSTSTAAAVVPRKPSPAEIAVVAAETADGPVHGEFPVVSVDGSRLTRRWQWGEVVAIDQVPRATGLSDPDGPATASGPSDGTGPVEATGSRGRVGSPDGRPS